MTPQAHISGVPTKVLLPFLKLRRRWSSMILRPEPRLHRYGIHTLAPLLTGDDPEEVTGEPFTGQSRACSVRIGFPVVIGGNHTVSIGAFRAASEAFAGLTILQLDAHSDLRPSYEGSHLNHACAAARAKEHAPLVQVGIRSMSAEELPFVDRKRIFYAHELYSDKRCMTRRWICCRECLHHGRPRCV
jgi:agmatinase